MRLMTIAHFALCFMTGWIAGEAVKQLIHANVRQPLDVPQFLLTVLAVAIGVLTILKVTMPAVSQDPQ